MDVAPFLMCAEVSSITELMVLACSARHPRDRPGSLQRFPGRRLELTPLPHELTPLPRDLTPRPRDRPGSL